MSSLRNATKRIEKKERAQPASRRALGLLEKKKDYRQRSQNYHAKEDTLKKLKVKAALRNPDEFYFAMVNKKTRGGVHEDLANNTVSNDVLRLYRTQNAAYIDSKLTHEKHALEKIQSRLHFVDEWKGQHTVFMDDDDDDYVARDTTFDPAQYFDTVPELVSNTSNRLTRQQLAIQTNIPNPPRTSEIHEKAYRALDRATSRVQKLESAKAHLQLKRHLMGKGKRTKVKDAEGDRPAVYSWRSERKR